MMFFFLFVVGVSAQMSPIIIPPTSSEGPETLLICSPGMSLAHTSYVDICTKTQQSLPFRTWVSVLGPFPFNLVSPEAIQEGIDLTFQQVSEMGFSATPADTFLWAHSASGVFATALAVENGFAGFVLIGTHLDGPSTDTLRDYPIPTFHVGGELDGLTPIARLAEEFKVTAELVNEDKWDYLLLNKAVLLVPGTNHAQQAGNYYTPSTYTLDYSPEISLSDAEDAYALLVAAFIDLHRTGNSNSYQVLKDSVLSSSTYFMPLINAQEMDVHQLCAEDQRLIANLDPFYDAMMLVENTVQPDMTEFGASKTDYEFINDTLITYTHSYLEYEHQPSMGPRNTYTDSLGYEALCKSRTQESIIINLNATHGREMFCKDVNEGRLVLAMSMVPDHVASRYEREGIKFVYRDDVVWVRGSDWIASHLSWVFEDDHVVLQSSSLWSGMIAPEPIGGAAYCKLLPLTQAIAWVQLNGLPRGIPSPA
eukprot:Lithocolla_globosa_v1_NODE_3794_length_1577_cov_11.475690.p1 type:complete len:480 gc:universal NODE_3794_length_1577_cov_11.475690:43-1482(+)